MNFCINLSLWNNYDLQFFSFLKNILSWNFNLDLWITGHKLLIQTLDNPFKVSLKYSNFNKLVFSSPQLTSYFLLCGQLPVSSENMKSLVAKQYKDLMTEMWHKKRWDTIVCRTWTFSFHFLTGFLRKWCMV